MYLYYFFFFIIIIIISFFILHYFLREGQMISTTVDCTEIKVQQHKTYHAY